MTILPPPLRKPVTLPPRAQLRHRDHFRLCPTDAPPRAWGPIALSLFLYAIAAIGVICMLEECFR